MERHYAVVCYLHGELAEFAGEMRRRLNPALAHLPPHITLLPPRPMQAEAGTPAESGAMEARACGLVAAVAAQLGPVRCSMGEVKTFLPNHPTVYVEVQDGARHLRYANSALKQDPFTQADTWPYVPHLTLATLADENETRAAWEATVRGWEEFRGERGTLLNEMSLVREEQPERWVDICSFPFGG